MGIFNLSTVFLFWQKSSAKNSDEKQKRSKAISQTAGFSFLLNKSRWS